MASLLEGLFSRKWTLSDISNTDQERQQRSYSCSPSFVESYIDLVQESIIDKFKRFFTRNKSTMNICYVTFKFIVTGESGKSYTVYIRTQYDPDSKIYMQNEAEIYCSCPDFKFNSAWTLGQHSALFLSDKTKLDLGEAVTNAPKKKRSTVLCKHSYAAVTYLIDNYQALMRNV